MATKKKTYSITELPSGQYRAQIMVDGKRYSITRRKESQVIEAIEELRQGVVSRHQSFSTMTVKQMLTLYVEDKAAVLSPATVSAYRAYIDRMFPSMMSRPVSTINARQWQLAISKACLTDKAPGEDTYSAKTIKNWWGLVTASLSYYDYPIPKVQLPQVVQQEHEFLTPEQIKVFIECIHGKRVEIPALLALHGLRRSELLALTWDQIDLNADQIQVAGSVVRDSKLGKFVRKNTNKNISSRRIVPIVIPQLHDALSAASKDKPPVDYNPGSIYGAINRICEKNGLPSVGVHGLRHSFASLCYSKGIPEKICQRLGGWNDDTTMKKIYTHLADRDINKSVVSLKEFFS